MSSKVNLADVIVAQHGGVSGIGGVVGRAVVDGAAGGKGQAGLQPVLLDEPPGAVLQLLTAGGRQQQAGCERSSRRGLLRSQQVWAGGTSKRI